MKPNPNSPLHRDGFTLIELLVVISIIALLIAILLPALGKARKTSRSIVCQSTIKQLGVWAITYGVDNKGILPTHGDTNWSQTWVTLSSTDWLTKAVPAGLYKGWGNDCVLKCPEAMLQVNPIKEPWRNMTYGINQFMGGMRDFGSNRIAPTPRMELLNSRGYWFGEARAVYYSTQKYYDFHPVLQLTNSATATSSWPWSWPNPSINNATGHPEENGSFLFGDGHVKLVSKNNFQDMTSADRYKFIAQFY